MDAAEAERRASIVTFFIASCPETCLTSAEELCGGCNKSYAPMPSRDLLKTCSHPWSRPL